MLGLLAGLIPPQFRLMALALAFAATFAAGGASGWKLQGWRLGVQIADMKAEAAALLASAQANARKKEQEHERLADLAEKNHQFTQAQNRALSRDLRRLAAESGGLRDPYAAGCVSADAAPTGGADAGAASQAWRFPEGRAGLLSPPAAEFILQQAELADDLAAYAWACHQWATGLK